MKVDISLCLAVCGMLLVQDHPGAAGPQATRIGAVLDVSVSSGNQPTPNATVVAAEEQLKHVASARTDDRGRAQLVIPTGRYRVSASLDGYIRI